MGFGLFVLMLVGSGWTLWAWQLQAMQVPLGETATYVEQWDGRYRVRDYTRAADRIDEALQQFAGPARWVSEGRSLRERELPGANRLARWPLRHGRIEVAGGGPVRAFWEAWLQQVAEAGGRVFSVTDLPPEGEPAQGGLPAQRHLLLEVGLEAPGLEGEPLAPLVTHLVEVEGSYPALEALAASLRSTGTGWRFGAGEPAQQAGVAGSAGAAGPAGQAGAAERAEPAPPVGPAPSSAAPREPSTRPEGTARAYLAVVIDDWGYPWPAAEMFLALNRPITAAIIPFLPESENQAKRAVQAGFEVIVHLPMEARDPAANGSGPVVRTGMAEQEIEEMVEAALRSLPQAVGVSNHQGSRATADPQVMGAVLRVLRERRLFFLDSFTASDSVVPAVARSMGVPFAQNGTFIDNVKEVEAVKARLRRAGQLALQRGFAIAIGHVRVATARGLREAIPELEAMGVQLVPVSWLLNWPSPGGAEAGTGVEVPAGGARGPAPVAPAG